MERPFFTQAACHKTDAPVEAFSIEEQKGKFEMSASSIEEVKDTVLNTPNWLPIAAEQYNISRNIKDYILLPVTAIISDLPNRNAHSFSAKTLTSWVNDRCQVMAHTFTGVPVHKNHCIIQGTQIRMAEGYKNIEDIVIGDIVQSSATTFDKVIEVFHNPPATIYEVKCKSKSVFATDEHPFAVLKEGTYSWINAVDLTPGVDNLTVVDENGDCQIEEVESVSLVTDAPVPVFNIEVEDKNAYFANDIYVHNCNKDPTIAKGIVLSSVLKPMEGTSGKLVKVVMLAALDRTRDSVLANKFLTGELDSFSMGAYTQDYRSTCCGALATKGGCDHIQSPHNPKIAVVDGNRLGYWSTVNPSGFELSALENSPPAYEYATKHNLINMAD